jgi:transposase
VHTALKEYNLVSNHFNNGKSIREIAKIIQRRHFTVKHIVKRHKKGK